MADKRIRFILLSFKEMKAYLIEFIAEIMRFPLYILILYFLWKAIIENSTMQASLNDMVTYYAVLFFIGRLTGETWVAKRISKDVKEGGMVKILSRPVTYMSYQFWQRFGTLIFYTLLYLPVAVLFNFFFKMSIKTDAMTLILFSIAIVLAMLLNFMLMFLLGTTSFWITENRGVIDSFGLIKNFLSGRWIPLSLIPGALGKAILIFPFKYMVYFPITIIQGKVSTLEAVQGIGYTVVWVILFYFAAKIMWHYGEKHLTGVGV